MLPCLWLSTIVFSQTNIPGADVYDNVIKEARFQNIHTWHRDYQVSWRDRNKYALIDMNSPKLGMNKAFYTGFTQAIALPFIHKAVSNYGIFPLHIPRVYPLKW